MSATVTPLRVALLVNGLLLLHIFTSSSEPQAGDGVTYTEAEHTKRTNALRHQAEAATSRVGGLEIETNMLRAELVHAKNKAAEATRLAKENSRLTAEVSSALALAKKAQANANGNAKCLPPAPPPVATASGSSGAFLYARPASPFGNLIGLPGQLAGRPPQSKARIVLFTAIFGNATRAPHLPFFFRSAAKSGFDVVVFGDPPVPFEMPPNVRQLHMTWDNLANLLSEKLFNGTELVNLKAQAQLGLTYKIIDFKPLYAFLMNEQVKGYDFWGYCDNDMMLGSASHHLSPEFLADKDIISGMQGHTDERTWGPFTLMRNTKQLNELFMLSEGEGGLLGLFDSYDTMFFDEWGGNSRQFYSRSMSAIITKYEKKLGLRVYNTGFPIGWDGECEGKAGVQFCSECVLTTVDDQTHLTWNRSLISPDEKYLVYEVMLCHYQVGKKAIKTQLSKMTEVDKATLLKADPLSYGYPDGFYPSRVATNT